MADLLGHLRSIGVGAAIVFIGSIIGRGISLLAQVVIARRLGPNQFGNIALAITMGLFFSQIATLGIPDGITRQISSVTEVDKKRDIVLSGIVLLLPSSTIIAIFTILSKGILVNIFNNNSLYYILPIVSIYILLKPFSEIPTSILRSEKSPVFAVLLREIIPKLSGLISVLILITMNMRYGVLSIYWVIQPVAIIIASVLLGNRFIQYIWPLVKPDSKVRNDLLSFSWPLAIEAGFLLLMSNMDVIMIGFFLPSNSVGLYRAVQPISFSLGLVISSAVFLYLPNATELYSNREVESLDRLFKYVTKWTTLATVPLASILIFESRTITVFLFSEDYIAASTSLSILSIGMLLRVIVGPNGATIKAIDQTKINLYATIVAGCSNIAMNYALIPEFGINGAALATALSYLIYNLIELAIIYHAMSIHPFSLNLAKPTIFLLMFGGIVSFVVPFTGLVRLMVYSTTLALCVPVSLVVTKSLDQDEVYHIKSVVSQISL